ncbi:hypothetical protein N493_19875 (plasmid) [Clostridium botulinum B2 433]|uniref:hypothetical protein n=1 Tax=Clostridium botulinum TaxID=1491 RepID=UPI0007DEB9A1|nr:hypothetical protein [Clostridium botulinum]KEI84148.1 hypothetical protein N493_19875 [Clostridium botulinum B2 433]
MEQLNIAIELAFQMGMAYQDLYTKADLANAMNFNDLQYAKSLGAQFKARGTMENLPNLFSIKTNKEKKIIEKMNRIVKNKKELINLCKR